MTIQRVAFLIILPLLAALASGARAQQPLPAGAAPAPKLHFEPMADGGSEADAAVYIARGASIPVVVSAEGLLLRLPGGRELRCAVVGSEGGIVAASEPTGGTSSYFLTQDPSGWVEGVLHYGKVTVRNTMPGVDLVCYPAGAHVEFDLELAVGIDPSAVRLRLDGVAGLTVAADGSIQVPVGDDTLTLRAPVAFQRHAATGLREEVASRYRVESIVGTEAVEIAFELAAHDSERPLVIDPIIEFSTLLGGSYDDNVTDVAFDPINGDTVLVGTTNSVDFPVVNALPQAFVGSHAFVSRFDSTGALVLSTYLGTGASSAFVDIDAYGNAVVAGHTLGSHPTTIGVLQPTPVGGNDWFATRLGRQGQLHWSTYYGGIGEDYVVDVEIGISGYVFIAGYSTGGFPTTAGSYSNSGAGMIVAAIDNGVSYQFATALGFTGTIAKMALDTYSGIWICGQSNANDMPTSANAFQTSNPGGYSGWVFGLTSDGVSRVASTYYGGSGGDGPADLFVRFDQNLAALYVTITGFTTSTDLPTANALQSTFGGSFGDGFVAQFSHLLGGLRFSTYVGDSGQDYLTRIAEDADNRILVAGWTTSINLPMDDAFQGPSYQGPCGYMMRLEPGGNAIDYATYFGGRYAGTNIAVTGLAVQPTGEAIVVGTTRNAVWYTTPNAIRPTFAGAPGSTDSFFLRFSSTTMQSYGQGTGASYYNTVPQLSGAGPLTPGSTVSLRLQDSTGGRVGILALGFTGPANIPLWGGTLLVNPASMIPFLVGGGANVQWGHWAYDTTLPAGGSLQGLAIQAQIVIGPPAYATFTPGIEMVLQ